MKYKLTKYRLTIPQEIREHTNISRDGYIDISYDDKTGNIIISECKDKNNQEIKPKKTEIKKDVQPKAKRRKIEANFMNADKLYKAYYSECGLVAKTKTRYVNDFCNECQGKLAKEWEDRAEVKCSRLIENTKNNTINEIRKNRKKELENISNSIKEANKVLDVKINDITKPKKRGRKPKKKVEIDKSNTVIKAVRFRENTCMKCSNCGQYFKSGFLLDTTFMCGDCAKQDFKEYMKKRGN